MSAEFTITGIAAMSAKLARFARDFPEKAGDALEKRVEVEVRSREKVSGNRLPLVIGRTEPLEVRVAWPYPHEGGEGTYVNRIVVEEAGRLLIDGLARDIGAELERQR